MGDCYIVRKGGSSSELMFNYVSNYVGFVSAYNTTSVDMYLRMNNFNFTTITNQDLTIEMCLYMDGSRTHFGRFFDYNNGVFVIEDYPQNQNITYLSIKSGGSWRIDAEVSSQHKIEIPMGENITITIRIDNQKTDIFIDGIYSDSSTDLNSSMLDNISIPQDCYFMDGWYSNRHMDGKMYAFRVYNRALSNSEINQNYNEDVKLINLLSGT